MTTSALPKPSSTWRSFFRTGLEAAIGRPLACLLLAWAFVAEGQSGDVTDLGILKQHNLVQNNDSTVVDDPANPFDFFAFTDTPSQTLLGSTLFPPHSVYRNLT